MPTHVEQRPPAATKSGEPHDERRVGKSRSESTPVPNFSPDLMENIANRLDEPRDVAGLQAVSRVAREFYHDNDIPQRTTLRMARFIEERYPTRSSRGSAQELGLLKGSELTQLADAQALRFRANQQIARSLEHVIASNDRSIAKFDVIGLAKDYNLPELATAVKQHFRPGARECFRFNGFLCHGNTFIAPDQHYRTDPAGFMNEIRTVVTDPYDYPIDRIPVYNRALSIFPQLRTEDRQTIVDLCASADRTLNEAPLQTGRGSAGLVRCWDHLSELQKSSVVNGLLGEPDENGFFATGSLHHHRVLRACVDQYAKLPDTVQRAVINRLTNTQDCINELPTFLNFLSASTIDDVTKAPVLDDLLALMEDRSARGATRWEMGIADRGCGVLAEALITLGKSGPEMSAEQTATCTHILENLQTIYPGLNLLAAEEADAFRNLDPVVQARHVGDLLDLNRPLAHRSQRSVHTRVVHAMFGALTPNARVAVLANTLREEPENVSIGAVENLFKQVQHISETQFRDELHQATALASTLRVRYPQRRRGAVNTQRASSFEDS